MRINWAYCGFGKMALKFHQSVQDIEEINVVAVATKSKLDIAKQTIPNARLYDSYEALALDPDVDIVYISTTHNFHMNQVELFASHGKAVLCEKPMIINQGQIDVLKKYQGKVLIMEAMWTRYLPAYVKAMALLKAGTIGKIKWFEASFCFDNPGFPTGRLQNKDLAGGAMYDIGIYPLAMALDLADHQIPTEIKSMASLNEQGVDLTTSTQIKWENDLYAQLFCSINRRGLNEARIHGSEGTIVLSDFWMSQKITVMKQKHVETFDIPFEANGYKHIILAFLDAYKKHKYEVDKMTIENSISISNAMNIVLNQIAYGS
jgi:predicted dehydrogenase